MTLLDRPIGSQTMALDDNFVSVLPAVLIDPVLKLRLEQGRWTPESPARGGSVDVQLSYDPEIRADRLTMPISETRRKLMEMLGRVTSDWTVFESDASRRIAEILVDIHDRANEVRLEFINSASALEGTALLLARQTADRVSANPYEVLLYMFRSVVLMEDLDERYAIPWGKNSITFCTSADIAEKLAAETGAEFERTEDGLAIIASRAVRS